MTRRRLATKRRPTIDARFLAAWIGISAPAAFGLAMTFALACSGADEPAGETKTRSALAEAADRVRAERADPGPRPRRVVVVLIDTLRPDHLGSYGYDRFTSPILDTLASEGAVFEDASSTSPWTLPSHASLFTGRHPLGHRVITYSDLLPETIPTVASLLRAAGLRTAAVVTSLWLERDTFGLTRDFDQFRYIEIPAERSSPSTMVTDQAIEWLRAWGDAPGFLFVHYYDVHSDYTSEPEYERLFVSPYDGIANGTGTQLLQANFEDEYIALCHEQFDEAKCVFGEGDTRVVVNGSIERIRFDEVDVQHLEDLYDAGIRQMDTEVGRLLRFIDEQGLADDTLLIVTSDHGEEFMEHGRVDHFLATHQESLRVPLIVRGPGVPAGVRFTQPVSIVDLAPTILGQLAHLDQEPGSIRRGVADMEGADLAPLWSGEEIEELDSRWLYGEASGGLSTHDLVPDIFPVFSSVRRGSFKLIHDTKTGRNRLYDLSNDPLETQDVSDRYPDLATTMRDALDLRRAAIAAARREGPTVELDAAKREQLRALGYVP